MLPSSSWLRAWFGKSWKVCQTDRNKNVRQNHICFSENFALDNGADIEDFRAVFLEELDVEPEIANISVRLYYTTELRNSFATKGDLDEGVMISFTVLGSCRPKIPCI